MNKRPADTRHSRLSGLLCDVRRAFSNLISNVVRNTPAGGKIALGWISDAACGSLSVRETRHAMPAPHLLRLTARCDRVSTSHRRDSGLAGLGLSIVKYVLQRHEARLDITGKQSGGSTSLAFFGQQRLLPVDASGEETP